MFSQQDIYADIHPFDESPRQRNSVDFSDTFSHDSLDYHSIYDKSMVLNYTEKGFSITNICLRMIHIVGQKMTFILCLLQKLKNHNLWPCLHLRDSMTIIRFPKAAHLALQIIVWQGVLKKIIQLN